MTFAELNCRPRSAPAHRVAGRAMRRPWRCLVALWTALAFSMLLTTAAAHHHKSSVEEHACVVCTAVIENVTTLAQLPALIVGAAALLYLVHAAIPTGVPVLPRRLLPPGRGPPAIFL